jgi:hypothetical protein
MKTHSVDQSERISGVELERMGVVGLGLLCLEDVARESNLDG